jgi:RNA polymerase sigma-70 factor (ECF subfamily)
VVLRADGGARPSVVLRGREEVAGQALTGPRFARWVRPVLVNGAAGVVAVHQGRPLSVMAFTVTSGKIVAIDVLMDPERLATLDLSAVGVSTVDG